MIAEAGVNHNGSIAAAKALVKVASEAGADAVKFQTFRSENLVTLEAPKAAYQKKSSGPSESQFEMLRSLELSDSSFKELFEFCGELQIEFMSTPFDEKSADMLHALGMRRFKIPSGEATNQRLIRHIASYQLPTILSTGMCTLEEVGRALDWLQAGDSAETWILQCVSNYPARPEDTNLAAMQTMENIFRVPVGLSDHTLGFVVALGAAARGAIAIEKHFTLDRKQAGPDHSASLEPGDLIQMIQGIREIESAIGTGEKVPTPEEIEVAKVARRSIVAVRDLPIDHVIRVEDLEFLRPGTGIAPWQVNELIGKVTLRAVPKHAIIEFGMFQ